MEARARILLTHDGGRQPEPSGRGAEVKLATALCMRGTQQSKGKKKKKVNVEVTLFTLVSLAPPLFFFFGSSILLLSNTAQL